jgi:hypothetical protein
MSDADKFFSGLSLLFLGLVVLSDPIPALLFLALIPIGIVLILLYYFALSFVARSDEGKASVEVEDANDQTIAIKIEHYRALVKVTVTWIGSGVVGAYSAFVLKIGLGPDWLPFVREHSIRKGDPLYGYATMDGIFVVAGFLFLSGLIWLPMSYLFAGLAAKQRLATIQKRGDSCA